MSVRSTPKFADASGLFRPQTGRRTINNICYAIVDFTAHHWPQPGKATVPSDCIHQLGDAAQQPFPALGIEFRELRDFLGHVAELVAIAVNLTEFRTGTMNVQPFGRQCGPFFVV